MSIQRLFLFSPFFSGLSVLLHHSHHLHGTLHCPSFLSGQNSLSLVCSSASHATSLRSQSFDARTYPFGSAAWAYIYIYILPAKYPLPPFSLHHAGPSEKCLSTESVIIHLRLRQVISYRAYSHHYRIFHHTPNSCTISNIPIKLTVHTIE